MLGPMQTFTTLERQAFDAMGDSHPALADLVLPLLRSARVTSRDNTGYGFYTRFEVDRSLPPVPYIAGGPLDGATFEVTARAVTLLMDFLLWFDDAGHPNCLEGYQFGVIRAGAVADETIDLRTEDIEALVRVPHPLSRPAG